jgi:hypothetical protein
MAANVRVANIRPRGYPDLRAWTEDPQNVYVGRRGVVFVADGPNTRRRFPAEDSPFANPFKVSAAVGREVSLQLYEGYIREKLRRDPGLRALLRSFAGKTLGCWCAPLPCHADVLVKILGEILAADAVAKSE